MMAQLAKELGLYQNKCSKSALGDAALENQTWEGLFHCHDSYGLKFNQLTDAVLPGAAKIATVQEPFHHAVSTWYQHQHGRDLDDHLLQWCASGSVQVNALMRKPGQTMQEVADEYDALMPTPYLHSALAYAVGVIGRCWPPVKLYIQKATNQNVHRSSEFSYDSLPQWHNATLRSLIARRGCCTL